MTVVAVVAWVIVLMLMWVPGPWSDWPKRLARRVDRRLKDRHTRRLQALAEDRPDLVNVAWAVAAFPRATQREMVRVIMSPVPLEDLEPEDRELLTMVRAKVYHNGPAPWEADSG